MSFKIGVMSDSFLCQTTSEALKKAGNMGVDGVQMYAVEGEICPDMKDFEIDRIKKALTENNLVISALCGDLGGHGFEKAADNLKKIEKSKRIIDLALEFGTNIVTTHIGCVPMDTNSDKYKIMQSACITLAEYAQGKNAFFAIETGPEKAQILKMFLDSLGSKHVGVNLDPANLVMVTGDDPVEAVHTLKDYIVHTHAKDGIMLKQSDPEEVYGFFADGGIGDLRLDEYFKEVPLGQGNVNFTYYLKALTDIGYSGFLTIERECGKNPAKDIGIAVDFLRSHIAFR